MDAAAGTELGFRTTESWRLLGQSLVEQGLLDDAGLERALVVQRQTQRRLGEILVELGLVSEAVLARAIARQYGVEPVSTNGAAAEQIDEHELRADQLAEQERLLAELAQKLEDQQTRMRAAEERLAEREARLDQLEEALAGEESLLGLLAQHRDAIAQLTPRVDEQRLRLEDAEARLEERERRLDEFAARVEQGPAQSSLEPASVQEVDGSVLARRIADEAHLPFVDLRSFEIDFGVAAFLPSDVALKHEALPIRLQQGVVIIAMADPTDVVAVAAVARSVARDLRFVVAERDALLGAIAATFS